eukprot:4046989-Ditylum_brightwellii.AAC.2
MDTLKFGPWEGGIGSECWELYWKMGCHYRGGEGPWHLLDKGSAVEKWEQKLSIECVMAL